MARDRIDMKKSLVSKRLNRSRIRLWIKNFGESAVFENLDEVLGRTPNNTVMANLRTLLTPLLQSLPDFACSEHAPTRRVVRSALLTGLGRDGDFPILYEGLKDPVGTIRGDAARWIGDNGDRSRLYNILVRMIREDPDRHVRISAGTRLRESFADLFSLDPEGLPPHSRLFALEALDGRSRADEERAIEALNEKDVETCYKAARYLDRSGVLSRLLKDVDEEGGWNTLKMTAELGVVGYLEKIEGYAGDERLIELATLAHRDDLKERFVAEEKKKPSKKEPPKVPEDYTGANEFVTILEHKSSEERDRLIQSLLENEGNLESLFLRLVENRKDRNLSVALRMAELGVWKTWEPIARESLESSDPETRCAALSCLGALLNERAYEIIAPFLRDPVERVRSAASMNLIASGDQRAHRILTETILQEPEEEDLSPVLRGIGRIGGAKAEIWLRESISNLPKSIIGQALKLSLDSQAICLIAESKDLSLEIEDAVRASGPSLGPGLIKALGSASESAAVVIESWIRSCDWPNKAVATLGGTNAGAKKKTASLIADLSAKQKHAVFQTALNAADKNLSRRVARAIKKA